MIISFLIGNGLDLSAGLKTSASDFLSDYIERYGSSERDSFVPEYALRLAKEIENDGVENWADFEFRLGEYSAEQDDPIVYLQACDHLSGHIHQWLEREQERITDEFIRENAKGCIDSIMHLNTLSQPEENNRINELKLRDGGNWDVYVVTFNYTNLFDRIVDAVISGSKTIGNVPGLSRDCILRDVIHAHEALDGCIVLGVNDELQITNVSFRDNLDVQRVLIKERVQRQLASYSDMRALEEISRSSIICIFGMAMGKTDRRWWEAVYKRLIESPETILIIFSHELGEMEVHTAYRRHMVLQTIKRKFFDGAGIDFDQELADRIIVAPSQKLFPLTPISRDEKLGELQADAAGVSSSEF